MLRHAGAAYDPFGQEEWPLKPLEVWANLSSAEDLPYLQGANLRGADLRGADLFTSKHSIPVPSLNLRL